MQQDLKNESHLRLFFHSESSVTNLVLDIYHQDEFKFIRGLK